MIKEETIVPDFFDKLQEATRTQEDLKNERIEQERYRYERAIQYQVDRIKSFCMYRAEKGFNTLEYELGTDDEHPLDFRTKAEASQFLDDLKEALYKEGFTPSSMRAKFEKEWIKRHLYRHKGRWYIVLNIEW